MNIFEGIEISRHCSISASTSIGSTTSGTSISQTYRKAKEEAIAATSSSKRKIQHVQPRPVNPTPPGTSKPTTPTPGTRQLWEGGLRSSLRVSSGGKQWKYWRRTWCNGVGIEGSGNSGISDINGNPGLTFSIGEWGMRYSALWNRWELQFFPENISGIRDWTPGIPSPCIGSPFI